MPVMHDCHAYSAFPFARVPVPAWRHVPQPDRRPAAQGQHQPAAGARLLAWPGGSAPGSAAGVLHRRRRCGCAGRNSAGRNLAGRDLAGRDLAGRGGVPGAQRGPWPGGAGGALPGGRAGRNERPGMGRRACRRARRRSWTAPRRRTGCGKRRRGRGRVAGARGWVACRDASHREERRRPGRCDPAIGVYVFVASAGGAVGLLAGGILTQAINWHWIFFVNLPIGIVTAVLALRVVPRSVARSARRPGPGQHAGRPARRSSMGS